MKIRSLALVCGIVAASTSALGQKPPRLIPLPMEPPSAKLASVPMGPVGGDQPIHVTVAVPFRDPVGAEQFVASVSNPTSPMYRHFITPEQVGAMFGYPASTLDKVAGYLRSQGLAVDQVASNGLAILAHGTVSQVNAAFNTSVEAFYSSDPKYADGPKLFSYSVTPSVPEEIAPYIGYVSGLENFTRPEVRGNSVTPAQLETFYGDTTAYSFGQGGGRTVGISNFGGFRLANLTTTYPKWSLPTPSGGIGKNVTEKIPKNDTGGANATANVEADLDIQCVLNVAPLCTLIIYSSTNNDPIGVYSLEATDNKADIITESYGWSSSSSSFYTSAHNEQVSMAAEGITYMAASGDKGTSSIGTHPWPDMEPLVLIVGGTTTNTSSAGALTSQTGWSGSGGGWFPNGPSWDTLPSWQKGKGVPTNVFFRLSPDVSLNADTNTPEWVYMQKGENGQTSAGWSLWGGTSAASPVFAGMLADSEAMIMHYGGLAGGSHRFGQIAPLLYSFNGNSRIFTDITTGSNGTLPNGKASNCTAGWDFVTGWGVMNFSEFAASQSLQTMAYTVSTASVVAGTSISGTVSLTGAAPKGGIVVSLTSSPTGTVENGTITIPAGITTATFKLTTSGVNANTKIALTAATTLGWSAVGTSVTVDRVNLKSVSLNPASLVGGANSTGTVTLTGPAGPSGAVVTLTSASTSIATVPASVTVPAGKTTATFTVKTKAVKSSTSVKISGSYGVAESATLTVKS